MSAVEALRRPAPETTTAKRLRRLLRSPKGMVMVVLLGLLVLASVNESPSVVVLVASAVVSAASLDLVLVRLRRGRWAIPDGAVVSGLVVAAVLSPQEPFYVPLTAGAVATLSKHLIRTPPRWKMHVFNPAAVALLVCILLFQSGESWWGGLADLPFYTLAVVIGAGAFIVDRINKAPQVLTFAAVYSGALSMAAFLANGGNVHLAEAFRAPFVQAAVFFAFFMLTDPPTSPTKAGEQVEFGFVVGLAAFFCFLIVPGLAFLPLSLLIGNAWTAWRRATTPARTPRSWQQSTRAVGET